MIDPLLEWSTYLGGGGWDEPWGIEEDSDGNILVSGCTSSSGWISGGPDTALNYIDAFVMKLTRYGNPLWSTYVGGTSEDRCFGTNNPRVHFSGWGHHLRGLGAC